MKKFLPFMINPSPPERATLARKTEKKDASFFFFLIVLSIKFAKPLVRRASKRVPPFQGYRALRGAFVAALARDIVVMREKG